MLDWVGRLAGPSAFFGQSVLLLWLLSFDFDFFHVQVFRPYSLVCYGLLGIWLAMGLQPHDVPGRTPSPMAGAQASGPGDGGRSHRRPGNGRLFGIGELGCQQPGRLGFRPTLCGHGVRGPPAERRPDDIGRTR